MVKSSLNRLAFTLIELLFAIMIMGITMASIPVIMSSNAKGFDATIIQEAIFAASAELNQALTFRWDENSRNEITNPNGLSRVIDVDGIGGCNDNTRLRPGHINQPLHRRCLDNNETNQTAPANFGPDIGDSGDDDIDDINQAVKPMFLDGAVAATTTTAEGYKHLYQSQIGITYAAIGDVNVTSRNAKLITITVTNDEDEVVTRLRSFTLNIGEVDFYKRTY